MTHYMSKKTSKLHISDWWKDVTSSSLGTIVGIVLTVGITYWQQSGHNDERALKITKITLHNIDVRTENLVEASNVIATKNDIFWKLRNSLDSLDKIATDSLLQDLNTLYYVSYYITDSKTESIFSHSLDVWYFLDDEKVVGRISNCYSAIDHGEEVISTLNSKIDNALHNCKREIIRQGLWNDPVKFAEIIANDLDCIMAFDKAGGTTIYINGINDLVRKLNNHNKEVLGLSDAELDELGKLYEQDSYYVSSDNKNRISHD